MHAPVPTEETTSSPTPPPENAAETPSSVTIASDPEIEAGIHAVMDAVPLATRHAVARAALRAGIRILRQDPLQIVDLLRERGKLPTLTATGNGGAQ